MFIYPSLYEGFGFPILEAMRSGAVVVGSNCGSIPEVGGNAMTYFDPYNIEQMAVKIGTLLGSETKREAFRKLGQNHVESFTWEKTAQETMSVIIK